MSTDLKQATLALREALDAFRDEPTREALELCARLLGAPAFLVDDSAASSAAQVYEALLHEAALEAIAAGHPAAASIAKVALTTLALEFSRVREL